MSLLELPALMIAFDVDLAAAGVFFFPIVVIVTFIIIVTEGWI